MKTSFLCLSISLMLFAAGCSSEITIDTPETTNEPTVIEIEAPKATEDPIEIAIEPIAMDMQELLVSSEWGQEGPFGMKIEFHEDGSFDERFAGEGDSLAVHGSYEVNGSSIELTGETFSGMTLEELEDYFDPFQYEYYFGLYGNGRTLELKESDTSLHFTQYLEDNGKIAFWNRSARVHAGEERVFENHILITVNQNMDIKPGVQASVNPNAHRNLYEFRACDMECETGPQHELSEIYQRTLARTQTKEWVNGVEDYWYLVEIQVPWYSVAMVNGVVLADAHPQTAWIHGGEFQ